MFSGLCLTFRSAGLPVSVDPDAPLALGAPLAVGGEVGLGARHHAVLELVGGAVHRTVARWGHLD